MTAGTCGYTCSDPEVRAYSQTIETFTTINLTACTLTFCRACDYIVGQNAKTVREAGALVGSRNYLFRSESLTLSSFFSIPVSPYHTTPIASPDANDICRCKGSTHISEDSSEIAFLLVENYQLTAPVGLRIGREFLEHIVRDRIAPFFFIRYLAVRWVLEKKEMSTLD